VFVNWIYHAKKKRIRRFQMAATVDARGLSCPQPVIMTLDEIRSGEDRQIIVLVDTDTSKENVTRAAESQGCQINGVSSEGEGYRITISRG
jgi:tRNA 2-thiouridine synthesizing protein A